MKFSRLLVLMTLTICALQAHAQNLDRFVGTVQAEWLDEKEGRKMRLLAPFTYYDKKGVEWVAPKGWIIDGASIPQFAWSFIGGPFEGNYRNASVIHDVACDQKRKPWEDVHEAFYNAMLLSNVESWRAKIMYAAVYHFGPRWPQKVMVSNIQVRDKFSAKRIALLNKMIGSTADIVNVHVHPSSSSSLMNNEERMGDIDLLINPPPSKMSMSDFEKLKQDIQQRESSLSGGLSLDQIRNYQPEH